MKKGKKILWLVLAVTAVVVLLVGGTAIWFFSDGIHTLGPFVHLEGEMECYRYDMDKGLTGDTGVLHMSGTGTTWDIPGDNIHDSGTFNGTFYLMGWPYDKGQGVMLDSENGKLAFTCLTIVWPEIESKVGHRLVVNTADGSFFYALIRKGEDTQYYVSSNDPSSAEKIFQYTFYAYAA